MAQCIQSSIKLANPSVKFLHVNCLLNYCNLMCWNRINFFHRCVALDLSTQTDRQTDCIAITVKLHYSRASLRVTYCTILKNFKINRAHGTTRDVEVTSEGRRRTAHFHKLYSIPWNKEQNLQQVRKSEGHLLWNLVCHGNYIEKLGVSIKTYRTGLGQGTVTCRTGLGQGTVTSQRKPAKITKKIIHSFYTCKVSVFFTTPPTHIPFF